jgi:hypothetical protein
MRERFWERFALDALTAEEWEALCDGCGRCCLLKLEDEDDGELYYTDLACRLLDTDSCRCQNYADRTREVPDCLTVTPAMARDFPWLPASCAYRRLARGQGLASWHPLVSGDPQSVRRAGISVAGRVTPETGVDEDEYEEHIVNWVE